VLGFAVALPNLHFHNQHHFFYFVDEGNPTYILIINIIFFIQGNQKS
jgi:hypothetical protein